MYKKLFVISSAALVLSACSAEPETTASLELKATCERAQPLVGQWKSATVTPEAKQAVSLAIASMEGSHTLDQILSVEEQVVAGKNYKVAFSLVDEKSYVANVYRNLNGEYKIVSLQPKSLVDQCVEAVQNQSSN